MRILFTGGSSFTGYWFINELAAAGHEIVATFRKAPGEYAEDPRRKRVDALLNVCRPVWGVSFGDDRFLNLIRSSTWDLFCAHGAEVKDYGSQGFDVLAALANNTNRLAEVLDGLIDAGCSRIIYTGTVFENDEGVGSMERAAFSPYGLSKGMSWQMFRYFAQARHMSLGKFVIPNPFGPYEERRFTHYLIRNWLQNAVPTVNTPNYVRDNIHVSLLAKHYALFSESTRRGTVKTRPSGYVETQAAFAERVANEMRGRLGLKCELILKTQTEYPEPQVRINTDRFDPLIVNWSESAAWDELATYYADVIR